VNIFDGSFLMVMKLIS